MFTLSNSACRKASWYTTIGLGLITVADGVLILDKIYLTLLQKAWMAVIGSVFCIISDQFYNYCNNTYSNYYGAV